MGLLGEVGRMHFSVSSNDAESPKHRSLTFASPSFNVTNKISSDRPSNFESWSDDDSWAGNPLSKLLRNTYASLNCSDEYQIRIYSDYTMGRDSNPAALRLRNQFHNLNVNSVSRIRILEIESLWHPSCRIEISARLLWILIINSIWHKKNKLFIFKAIIIT